MEVNDDVSILFKPGNVIARRWKIIDKLGEGAYGTVFKGEDLKTKITAAIKIEENSPTSTIMMEGHVLKQLIGNDNIPSLLDSGKTRTYRYVAMTLLGHSVEDLMKQKGAPFTTSTQVRIGIQVLSALKHLHDIGFIHRDIKPANMAVGLNSTKRKVFLLDYGLARRFVSCINGVLSLRPERKATGFRGTMLYASAHATFGLEQSRKDDIWGLIYSLVDMRNDLPWCEKVKEDDIARCKQLITLPKLFANCDPEFQKIGQLLSVCEHREKPPYYGLYTVFKDIMIKQNLNLNDKYDWELDQHYDGESAEQGEHCMEKYEEAFKSSGIGL